MARKVPITLRALLARINRKLAHEDLALRRSRSAGERSNLGMFYLLDISRNAIHGKRWTPSNLDELAEFARELGVMGEWERLDD